MSDTKVLNINVCLNALNIKITKLQAEKAKLEERKRIILSVAFVKKHGITKKEVWVPSSHFGHITAVQKFLNSEKHPASYFVNRRGRWLVWNGRLLSFADVKQGVFLLTSEGFAEHVPEAE